MELVPLVLLARGGRVRISDAPLVPLERSSPILADLLIVVYAPLVQLARSGLLLARLAAPLVQPGQLPSPDQQVKPTVNQSMQFLSSAWRRSS